jgi:hypothetical protein
MKEASPPYTHPPQGIKLALASALPEEVSSEAISVSHQLEDTEKVRCYHALSSHVNLPSLFL